MNIQTNDVTAVPTHVLHQAATEVADPTKIVDAAIGSLATDLGALFEDSVIDALRTIRADNPAEYTRIRARAKAKNKAFSLSELDRLIGQEGTPEDNSSAKLIALAREKCQLCHDADGAGVAIIEQDQHRQVWLVGSSGFSEWLRAEFFNRYDAGVADTTIKSALATIEAVGVFHGPQVEVHTRCAKVGAAYYIDLCDSEWRVVKIDSTGYELLHRSPVLFIRNDRMRPLPLPQSCGSSEMLWKYVNAKKPQRALIMAWLLECMRPDTPFVLLEIVGEQGSAKSTTQKHLRDLLDPNKVPLRSAPGKVEDIFVAGANNWIVSYENLSHLTNDEQDALCTLCTGGG